MKITQSHVLVDFQLLENIWQLRTKYWEHFEPQMAETNKNIEPEQNFTGYTF